MANRKVVAINNVGEVTIIEEPVPKPAAGQVLVEVKAALISPGTELGGARRNRARKDVEPGKPRKFGYGNAGVVIGRGEGCEDIEEGTRVACMGGGYAQHASHAVVPRNLTVPLPDEVKFEEGAFAHLAATALHCVRRANVTFGENVAVFGLGIVGQCAAQLSQICGAHVMGIDAIPLRLKLAKKHGTDLVVNFKESDPVEEGEEFSRGYGFDVGLIAFGGDASQVLASLGKMMKKAPDTHGYGRISIVGGVQFKLESFPVSMGNIDIRASSRPGPGYHDVPWEHGDQYPEALVPWNTRRNLVECIRAIAEGKLHLDHLITDRLPLEKAGEGCDKLIDHPEKAVGVILEP